MNKLIAIEKEEEKAVNKIQQGKNKSIGYWPGSSKLQTREHKIPKQEKIQLLSFFLYLSFLFLKYNIFHFLTPYDNLTDLKGHVVFILQSEQRK